MAGLFRSPDEAQQAYAAPLRLDACFGLRAFGGDDRDLPRLGGITPQFPGTMLNSLLCRLAVKPRRETQKRPSTALLGCCLVR